MWDSRNDFLYGSPITHPIGQYKLQLVAEAISLQTSLSLVLDPAADPWCFVAPNILRAHSILDLRQWLRLARDRLFAASPDVRPP